MEQRDGQPETDPWAAALARHFTDPEPPRRRHQVTLSGALLVIAVVGLVALVAGTAVLATLAVLNHRRADENLSRAIVWQGRSDELQELVGDRTKALNRQTARLAIASDRLRKARTAIARSEEDVATLQTRQRELAAEKAAVEDERASIALQRDALGGIAEMLVACNGVMYELVLAADGGYVDDGHVLRVQQECGAARAAVDDYAAAFGSR